MKPPSQLHGSKVLYWAWSGDKPFGSMKYSDGSLAAEIHGFAICIFADTILRVSCDRNWEVQNDMDFPTIQDAMNTVYPQYQQVPTEWELFDDTDIDALIAGSQRVKFYKEVGERRIIQKIVTHMKQHNCDGMWVQPVEKGSWLLSIQKKDIQIASEIAEQNFHDETRDENKPVHMPRLRVTEQRESDVTPNKSKEP